MILADKIIRLRKKNGWSQEELAEKMNVSRQAVSKWEGAQTVPDLEKILQLSSLFGVTTDYLLKDEIELEEFTDSEAESGVRRITLADANEYLAQRKNASLIIGIATLLCILSPVPLILLSVIAEVYSASVNAAAVTGLITLFVFVAVAVAMYLLCGFRNAPYEFLEKEYFEVEYGVKGMVSEARKKFHGAYVAINVTATCLCVISPLPLVVCAFTENELVAAIALAFTMLIVAIGVMLFIIAGVRHAGMQKLLKEGEYTEEEKKKSRLRESVNTVYWLVVLAFYLGCSFVTGAWNITWAVWPVAGILSAVITVVMNTMDSRK